MLIFFSVYVATYCAFAFAYLGQPDRCLEGVKGSFASSLWFSVQTASTIGEARTAALPHTV